jgi:hypothetical protein
MRIVPGDSRSGRARTEQVCAPIDGPVRDLASTLISLMAGTSAPDNLKEQLQRCSDAFAAYAAAHDGFLPDSAEILRIVDSAACAFSPKGGPDVNPNPPVQIDERVIAAPEPSDFSK